MRLDIRTQLIRALRGAHGYTDADLSAMLGVPAPSIRRLVGELRLAGWLISTVEGFYVLEEMELS